MAEVRYSEDRVLYTLDQVLAYGGRGEEHAPSADAAIIRTTLRLRFATGERWDLWNGDHRLDLPATEEEVQRGLAGWYVDDALSVDLQPLLPQATADTRITAAAQDPLLARRFVLVSSTDVCFWVFLPGQNRYERFPIANRPSWLPGHWAIYPIGGADILHDGTLIIACWAGVRVEDARAVDGIRHPEGRWCFYLHRLREPGTDPTRLDEDGNPIEIAPADHSPTAVNGNLVTKPFPGGSRWLNYDFNKFIAYLGNRLLNALFSDNSIKIFGYSRDVVGLAAEPTGITAPAFWCFELKADAFEDADSVPDDYVPQRVADDDDNPQVLRVLGAPIYSARNLYRSVFDAGREGGSYWLRLDGSMEHRSSVTRTLALGETLYALTTDSAGHIHHTALGEVARDDFRAVLWRANDEIWYFRRRGVRYEHLRAGVRYRSVAPYFVGASPFRASEGVDDRQRVRITLALPNETHDGRMLDDPGLVRAVLGTIWSPDAGVTWIRDERTAIGIVSSPKLQPGEGGEYLYHIDLYTLDSDIRRSAPRYFSNSDQQARYSGDRFFEGREELVDGTVVQWPPQPPPAAAEEGA